MDFCEKLWEIHPPTWAETPVCRRGGHPLRKHRQNRVKSIHYGCCGVATALLAVAYISFRNPWNISLQDRCRLLCDALTIPGLLMILSGALLWASNEGAFHGVSYCLRLAVFALIPGKRKDGYEKYGDYVERKGQKKVHGYAFLFWSGLMTMTIALVFFVLYYLQ